ncbi:hypothetical protein ACGC1H_001053 [Rhizoctonia solani]
MALNKDESHIANGGELTAPSEIQSAAAGVGINHWAIPPINKLPSEILTRIMWIVVSYAPCGRPRRADRREAQSPVLCYPDVLSHVCSQWRQVAIQSRGLWSHIDIPAWNNPGSRAREFLSRAGQLPLSLHLIDNFFRREDQRADSVPLLTTIMPRLKSLDLISHSDNLLRTRLSALSFCLSTCVAGNLTELAIRICNRYTPIPPLFLSAHSTSDKVATWVNFGPNWADIDLLEDLLEDVLKSITVLRLDQVYPQWTSSAYCGLVELRLLGGRSVTASIFETQLVNVLRSSPGLRILHFELEIVSAASLGTQVIDPICLRDLEVLNLDWVQMDEIEIFFRWLAPAPKLSQFSFRPFNRLNDNPAAVTFLADSNITMVHTNQLSLPGIVSLVSTCRQTRVLAIEDTTLTKEGEVLPFHFNTLYLIESKFDVECLRRFIQSSSVQKLIVHRCVAYQNNSKLRPDQVPSMLLDVCSNVLILPDHDSNPIEDWEVFWHL